MDSLLYREFIEKLLSQKVYTGFVICGFFSSLFILNYLKKWYDARSYFKKLNIPGPKPLPFIGNLHDLIRQGFSEHDINVIRKYGKTVGIFEGSTPIILTTDTKFIKNVMIKDFNSFVNHRVFEPIMFDPADKFMTVLKDEEWKNVRAIVTNAFTSGKLKSMFKYMNECTENFERYISQLVDKEGILDSKTLFSCYTLDVISTCCFGVSTNSIDDNENEFINHAKNIFKFSISFNPKILLFFIFPKFASYLIKKEIIEFFPVKSIRYFENFTNTVIERRKKKLEKRDDFIQNILDHEEKEEKNDSTELNHKNSNNESEGKVYKWNSSLTKTLTNKEILAQSVLFLLAGHETTAQTLTNISYNLAKNPKHQEKLCQEIDSVLEKHDGKISYESVHDMVFMDNVISETLRMFPPGLRVDRVANEDYEYEGIKIKKGMVWAVPIWALHRDPDIYPNPDEFRPERFDESEKKKRDNVSFLPFGTGPRGCIGMRFALLEIKLLLTSILSKYTFEKCEKTPEKFQIDNSGFGRSIDPIFVKVNRR